MHPYESGRGACETGGAGMSAVEIAADSVFVTEPDRGAGIRQRLDALGISDREWYTRTGIDRKTLNRAIENDERVRENTYGAIENWIERLEREIAGVRSDPADDLIEFRLSGNFGVDVVVKGPIRDRGELEDAVARLIREMRGTEQ